MLTPPELTPEMQQHIAIITLNRQNESNRVEEGLAFNKNFTICEIGKLVDKSKKNKVPGLDGIVYDILKNQVAIKVLTYLFNYCFNNNLIPSMWKKSLINPIPKGGASDPRTPLSYRGISLLPVIAKLYTAGLSNRISSYLESNQILVNEQNGFHPDRLCLDHIYTLHTAARTRLNHYQNTYMTFIDFSKAFDYVQLE